MVGLRFLGLLRTRGVKKNLAPKFSSAICSAGYLLPHTLRPPDSSITKTTMRTIKKDDDQDPGAAVFAHFQVVNLSGHAV